MDILDHSELFLPPCIYFHMWKLSKAAELQHVAEFQDIYFSKTFRLLYQLKTDVKSFCCLSFLNRRAVSYQVSAHQHGWNLREYILSFFFIIWIERKPQWEWSCVVCPGKKKETTQTQSCTFILFLSLHLTTVSHCSLTRRKVQHSSCLQVFWHPDYFTAAERIYPPFIFWKYQWVNSG